MNMENEEKNLKKCADFLSKIYSGENVSNAEIIDFCNLAIRVVSNDFSKYVQDIYGEKFVYPEIEFNSELSDQVNAVNCYSERKIFLNPKSYLPKDLRTSICSFLNTLGHEFTHYSQHMLADLSDSHQVSSEVREEANIMKDILYLDDILPNEIDSISTKLKTLFGEEFISEFADLSIDEKRDRCETLSFGSYLQLRYEEQAREGGYEFAKVFFDKVEPFIDDQSSFSFEVDKSFLSSLREINVEYDSKDMTEYIRFKQNIMESLQNIDKTRLQREERELKHSYLYYKKDPTEDEENYLVKFANEQSLLNETVRLLYQDCPISQLLEDFLVYFSDESFSCAKEVFKTMKSRNCSEYFMEGINETLIEYLKNQPFTNTTCDFDFGDILTKEQIDDITKSLIQQGRLTLAFNLIKNDSNYRTYRALNNEMREERINKNERFMQFLEVYSKRIEETYEKFLSGEDVLIEKNLLSPERGGVLGGIFSDTISEETEKQLIQLRKYYEENKDSEEFINKQNELRKQVYIVVPEEPLPECFYHVEVSSDNKSFSSSNKTQT